MLKIAVVHWLDAIVEHGQITLASAEALSPLPVVSAGLLIKQDEGSVIIAADFLEYSDGVDEHRYRDVSMIPRTYITKIEIKEFEDV